MKVLNIALQQVAISFSAGLHEEAEIPGSEGELEVITEEGKIDPASRKFFDKMPRHITCFVFAERLVAKIRRKHVVHELTSALFNKSCLLCLAWKERVYLPKEWDAAVKEHNLDPNLVEKARKHGKVQAIVWEPYGNFEYLVPEDAEIIKVG